MRFFTRFSPLPSLVACAAILVAGCHASGDGTGSAPPESDPCPATLGAVTEGAPCNGARSTAARICCYVDGTDGGSDGGSDANARVSVACGAAGSGATVAYCAGGTNPDGGGPATWDLQTPGDAGSPDTGAADTGTPDTAADAADAADASETSDAADASDASETTDAADDAADAAEVADADDAG